MPLAQSGTMKGGQVHKLENTQYYKDIEYIIEQ